jgi:large subunit ribosomal protein L24
MAARIRKGDKVVVISGRDKGKTGEVELVLPKENRAVVGGINMAVRHTRQTPQSPGGRLPKALPIDMSNLMLVDAKGKPTRVGFRFDEAGKKIRYAKTTGDAI